MATDSGNFMGYPAMLLGVPDEHGLVFTQAFQSIGLGLATALGAAIARPDRLTVAALGDGGALMGASELETAVRLGINNLVVVVYDDEAYGAEVHHFGPHGDPLDNVVFPAGHRRDRPRLRLRGRDGPRPGRPRRRQLLAGRPGDRPLFIHAKVTKGKPSWWLEEAFRGH